MSVGSRAASAAVAEPGWAIMAQWIRAAKRGQPNPFRPLAVRTWFFTAKSPASFIGRESQPLAASYRQERPKAIFEPVALFVRCFDYMDCEVIEKRFLRGEVERARELATSQVAKRIFSRFFDHGWDLTGITCEAALPPSPAPRKRKDAILRAAEYESFLFEKRLISTPAEHKGPLTGLLTRRPWGRYLRKGPPMGLLAVAA